MRHIIALATLAVAATGCATNTKQVTEYVTPLGERWVVAAQPGGASRPASLSVNGERIAYATGSSGGATFGSGIYHGQVFSFNCTSNRSPDCAVYAGGELITDLITAQTSR